jgi:hypothetical protein
VKVSIGAAAKSGGEVMVGSIQNIRERSRRGLPTRALLFFIAAFGLLLGGCAAVTNPVGDGVPVRRVPVELLAIPKGDDHTIPLTLLRQPPPPVYTVAPGDVLGVFIEGFLGERNQPLPIHTGLLPQSRDLRRLTPATGYPVVVQPDGTIHLPQAGKMYVSGKTIVEIQDAIRPFYIEKKVIKPDVQPLILVSLLQPRQTSVLVLRQEALTFGTGPDGLIATSKRGTGFEVDLPGNENDVLHALARTGGLPGLDVCNELIIQRGCFRDAADRSVLMNGLQATPSAKNPLEALGAGGPIVRIPLRLPPGHPPCLRPEDVILQNGDVVFLEARDEPLFFTAGLLPPAAHVLPRDRDLDVVEAVALSRGPLINGAFGGSNLSGDLVKPGIGNPSPTHLTVVRRTPGGGQLPITVDLGRALNDPSERLLVKAGDLLLLQEKPEEALARWFSQTFFNFDVVWQAFHSRWVTGVIDVSAPDRLTTTRLPTVNIPQQ